MPQKPRIRNAPPKRKPTMDKAAWERHDGRRQHDMRQEAALGKPVTITCHWTAGTYTQVFDHYHFCITFDTKTHKAKVVQTRSITLKGSHCRRRNTGNIGISLCGMATGYPITKEQIEVMAKLLAELCLKYEIPLERCHDHAYWAKVDGYSSERWDIGDKWLLVKGKARWYLDKLERGEAKPEYTLDIR